MSYQDLSPNPHRLHRDPDQGLLLGVCAGIAEYFGINRGLVRFLAVIALVLFSWLTLLVYIGLGIYLPKKPRQLRVSPEEATFWRGVSIHPRDTLSGLKQRFQTMERRIIALEANVTSPDFELRRQFRNL